MKDFELAEDDDTYVNPDVRRAVIDAVKAGVAEDAAAIAANLRVLADHGDGALYFACVSWSRTFREFASRRDLNSAPGETMQLQFLDVDGTPLDADDERVPAVGRWVGRMISAAFNNDETMQMALFDAVRRRPDVLSSYALQLLRLACNAVREAERG